MKHSGSNHAWIHISSEGNHIRVGVRDAGKGFNPETLHKKTNDGFGLFHVFERIELLGGSVKVESAPGKRAHFCLSAPASAQETKPLPQQQEHTNEDKETDKGNNKRIRLLIVDDHKILRQGLINMLDGRNDLQVIGEAADGEEAIRLAGELAPDVIIMDITMPKMNGIEATGQIKSRWV